jgi:hypothetical protein
MVRRYYALARLAKSTGETRPLQCAGINRHEAEEEESLRVRTSEPLGPEFCTWHREVFGEA